MSKSMKRILVLAKVQSSVGVAEVLDASADAILARAPVPNPANTEFQDRDIIRPYLGNSGKVQISNFSTLEFEVEMAGAGAAGDVPAYGQLLRGCAFAQNIVAATSVDYTPISENMEFLTMEVYLDGIRHRMTDCKGTVSLALSAGGIPVYRFVFTGFYAAPTDAANPAGVDYSSFLAPLGVNKANTPTFTIHGYSAKAKEFNIDMQNEVQYRNYIGAEDVSILERTPTGSLTVEYDDIANINWWEKARLGTLDSLQMIHGTAAGNIVQIDAPKVQVTNPSISDDNNVAMIQSNLELNPNLGNDEIVISVR